MTGIELLLSPQERTFRDGMRWWRDNAPKGVGVEQVWADPPAEWFSPTLDRNRLLTVLAYIEAHPELWNQNTYLGERACVGGLTVALELEVAPGLVSRTLALRGVVTDQPAHVLHLAKELLGLSIGQAVCIFAYTRVRLPGAPQSAYMSPQAQSLLGLTHRHPTFGELVDRVRLVTGVDYFARKPPTADQSALEPPVAVLVPDFPPELELAGAAA